MAAVFLLVSTSAPSAVGLFAAGSCLVFICVVTTFGLPWLKPAAVSRLRSVFASAAIACFALGYFSLNLAQRLQSRIQSTDEGSVTWVTGRIAAMPINSNGNTRFLFKTEPQSESLIGDQPRVLSLGWYQPRFNLAPGQRWRLAVRLKRPIGPLNPGGYDLEAMALANQIDAFGSVVEKRAGVIYAASQLTSQWSLGSAIEQLRSFISQGFDRLDPAVGHSSIGLLKALSIGEQSALSAEQWQLFNRTGTSHLMSISGMHVTMLAGLGGWAAVFLWHALGKSNQLSPSSLRANWRACAMLLVAGLYCAIAGWGIPAQRTFLMLLVWVLLTRCGRSSAFLYQLQLSALAVLVIDPLAIAAPGFWLSFLAVACLTVANRTYQGQSRFKNTLLSLLRTQVACTLGLMPLLAYFYSSLSLSSLLANAVAIPFIGFVVTPIAVVSAVLVAAAYWMPWLNVVTSSLAQLSQWMIDPLYQYLFWLDQFKFFNLPLSIDQPWVALVTSSLFLIALSAVATRWRAVSALVALALLWPNSQGLAATQWQLHVIDVGNGAAALIRTATETILIDAGPGRAHAADAGANVVAPYLFRLGIKTLDAVVLTHDDSEHIGGASSIFKLFYVKRLIKPKDLNRASTAQLTLSGEGNPLVIDCQRGGQLLLNSVQMQFLHPSHVAEREKLNNANTQGCVLQAAIGQVKVLFAADILAAQEQRLVQLYANPDSQLNSEPQLRSQILVVPNAGSASSSSNEFIAAVGAKHAVIQVGYRNRYSYPRSEVVSRYLDSAAVLHRTDLHGAIVFDIDGESVQVKHTRERQQPFWRQTSLPALDSLTPVAISVTDKN